MIDGGPGYIELVDVLGYDEFVAETAWLTSQAEVSDDPAAVTKAARHLLRYLMRHRHTTPIEFCQLVFQVKVPMDTWRQWIRHRMSSTNEYSTRYSPAIDDMLKTKDTQWRLQSKSNRQGSSGDHVTEWPEGYGVYALLTEESGFERVAKIEDAPEGHKTWVVAFRDGEEDLIMARFDELQSHEITPGLYLSNIEQLAHDGARGMYAERLNFGVAKEQARKDLPLSNFTEARWSIDLHNLFHFLGLRMDSHAQKEIRDYANIIGDRIVRPLFPLLWEAFQDYVLEAMRITRLDRVVIDRIMEAVVDGYVSIPLTEDEFMKYQYHAWVSLESCRERNECFHKLQQLSIVELDPAEE